jgi:hypothetical protein
MKDTKLQSLLKGRLGAALLAAVSFACITFGLSPEDSQTATDSANAVMIWVASGSSLFAGIMAFISKLRE